MDYIFANLFKMPVQITGCAILWVRSSVHHGSVGRKY